MSLLQELLNEQDKNEPVGDQIKDFNNHARNLGLKVHDGGDDQGSAFIMRDDRIFDVYFSIESRTPNKVRINYILGEGKQYNTYVPLERFLSFTKNELADLQKELHEFQDEYSAAVKIVKQMPKRIKASIEQKVK